MHRWFSILRSRSRHPGTPRPPVFYSIPCHCGRTVSGERQSTHQVVRCPDCQRAIFVLPLSPLPDPTRFAQRTPAVPLMSRPGPRTRLLLLTALFLSLLLGVGLYVLAQTWPGASGLSAPLSDEEARREADALRRYADQAIARGDFYTALEHLDALASLRQHAPPADALAAERREIALYADRLSEPLEELLHYANSMPEAEWRATFARRFRGKSILLDVELWRDGAGEIRSSYLPHSAGDRVTLALGELHVLRDLLLNSPRRVLLGARLADISRPRAGAWQVRFEPDSGVLLTDAAAAAACCPPLAEPAARAVLDRQRQETRGAAAP